MPDVEEKTVDIDTTGPGAEVNIEEEKKEAEVVETVEPVVEKEEKVEEKKEPEETKQEEIKEEPKTADQETKPKEELEQNSEVVQ